jgi:hypothetical protein
MVEAAHNDVVPIGKEPTMGVEMHVPTTVTVLEDNLASKT